jgi:DNA-binding MarR family transcriptional regulator
VNTVASVRAGASEDDALDHLAVALVQQAALLSRLVFLRLDVAVSRSEASLLARLETGPQRITGLADLDGLAQPTVTLLVKNLEHHGMVRRERSPDDGRVVLVSLTDAGHRALELVRTGYRERMRTCLSHLADDEIATLQSALPAMASLVQRLQPEGAR